MVNYKKMLKTELARKKECRMNCCIGHGELQLAWVKQFQYDMAKKDLKVTMATFFEYTWQRHNKKVDIITEIYVASGAGEQAVLASACDSTLSWSMERDRSRARRRPDSWRLARSSHDSSRHS